jgi:hypothetical protein
MAGREASELLLEALRGHEDVGLSIEDALRRLAERGYQPATLLNAIDVGKIRLGDRLRIFAAHELEAA